MNARELSAEAAAARLAFVTAVAELRWRSAQQASVAMGPLPLTELRQDPALEMAVVDACAGGPAWLQDAMRPLLFQDVPCVTRTKERGAWREEAIRSVAAANVAWAAAERLARIGTLHGSTACRSGRPAGSARRAGVRRPCRGRAQSGGQNPGQLPRRFVAAAECRRGRRDRPPRIRLPSRPGPLGAHGQEGLRAFASLQRLPAGGG